MDKFRATQKTFAPLCCEIIQKTPHSISLSLSLSLTKGSSFKYFYLFWAAWYEAHDNLNVATANLNRKAEKRAYDKGMGLQNQWILCNHAHVLILRRLQPISVKEAPLFIMSPFIGVIPNLMVHCSYKKCKRTL